MKKLLGIFSALIVTTGVVLPVSACRITDQSNNDLKSFQFGNDFKFDNKNLHYRADFINKLNNVVLEQMDTILSIKSLGLNDFNIVNLKANEESFPIDDQMVNKLTGSVSFDIEAATSSHLLIGSSKQLTVPLMQLKINHDTLTTGQYDNLTAGANYNNLFKEINNHIVDCVGTKDGVDASYITEGIDYSLTVSINDKVINKKTTRSIQDIAGTLLVEVNVLNNSYLIRTDGTDVLTFNMNLKRITVQMDDSSLWDFSSKQTNVIINDSSNPQNDILNAYLQDEKIHKQLPTGVNSSDFQINLNIISGQVIDASFVATIVIKPIGDIKSYGLVSGQTTIENHTFLTGRIDISNRKALPSDYYANVSDFKNIEEFANSLKGVFVHQVLNIDGPRATRMINELTIEFTNDDTKNVITEWTEINDLIMNSEIVDCQIQVTSPTTDFVPDTKTLITNIAPAKSIENLQRDIFSQTVFNISSIQHNAETMNDAIKKTIYNMIIFQHKYYSDLQYSDLLINIPDNISVSDLKAGDANFINIVIQVTNQSHGWYGIASISIAPKWVQSFVNHKQDVEKGFYIIDKSLNTVELETRYLTTTDSDRTMNDNITAISNLKLISQFITGSDLVRLPVADGEYRPKSVEEAIQSDITFFQNHHDLLPPNDSHLEYLSVADWTLNYQLNGGKTIIPWVFKEAIIHYSESDKNQITITLDNYVFENSNKDINGFYVEDVFE